MGRIATVYTYRYDGLGRLSEATNAEADRVYVYDKNSNLVAKHVTSGGQVVTTSYGIGAANRLLSFATTANPPGAPLPSATFTYDANGNEVGGSRAWAFNARNQATSVPGSTGGTMTQSFLGEGQAERVSEGVTTFRYNRAGLELADRCVGHDVRDA